MKVHHALMRSMILKIIVGSHNDTFPVSTNNQQLWAVTTLIKMEDQPPPKKKKNNNKFKKNKSDMIIV